MAITDKVIEMEPKKTGRNIAIIVVAAVMAALAVAMVILYVTKETPTEPPSVEMITLASSDLHTDSGSDDITYRVSPGASYTLYFDAVLKGGYKPEEVSPLLKFDYDYAGILQSDPIPEFVSRKEIDPSEGDEDDEDSDKPYYYRYKYDIVISEKIKAGTLFNIIVSSEFSTDVSTVLKCLVTATHTEYFDLKASEDNSRVLENYHMDSGKRVEGDPLNLVRVEDKDDSENTIHYASSVPISYYSESAFRTLNNWYIVSFDQLGSEGTHGTSYAKVMRGTGINGQLDQVKVSVADYDNTAGKYKSYVEMGSTSKTTNLTVSDVGSNCNSQFRFMVGAVGKSRIKIEANMYNESPLKPVIILDVSFVSFSSLDYVSKIIFKNPYNPDEETNSIDLYYGNDISNSKSFVLSDLITVYKSGKEEYPKWSGSAINGYVSDSSGNALTGAAASSALIARNTQDGDFAIRMRGTTLDTGTAYVTVRDYDTNNPLAKVQTVQTIIKINIRASIPDMELTSASSSTYGSGDEGGADIACTFDKSMTATLLEKHMDSLSTSLTVQYPEGLKVPEFDKESGEVKNADKTILFNGFALSEGNVVLNPKFKQEGVSIAAVLGFKIGKEVADGEYVFTIILAPQGLTKSGGEYEPLYLDAVTLTVRVTRLAAGIKVNEDFVFSSDTNDQHTIYETTPSDSAFTEAHLVIGIGTGDEGYTGFTIKDLIRYTYSDGSDSDDRYGLNFAKLQLSPIGGSALSRILKGGKADGEFIVPATTTSGAAIDIKFGGETFVRLNIEYKYVVGMISLSRGTEADWTNETADFIYEIAYNSSDNFTLGNNVLDGVTLVSTNGKFIGDKAEEGEEVDIYGHMMHPEKYKMNVAVVLKDEPHLLKSAVIGDYIYYFDEYTSEEDLKSIIEEGKTKAEQVAYLRSSKDITMSNCNLMVINDLFKLSVERAKEMDTKGYLDASLMTLRIYYSYNVDKISVNDENVVNHTHNSTVTIYNDELLICSTYRLVRTFDALRLYTDDTYTDELDKEEKAYEMLLYSGNYVDLYYSGVILIDGDEFIVERDNTYDIPVSGYNPKDGHETATKYSIEYERDEHLNESEGKLRVMCKPEDGLLTRSITVREIDCHGEGQTSAVVDVSFSNVVANIEKFELFSDPERHNKLTSVTRYTNDEESAREITVYYRITYAKYKLTNNGYDDLETYYSDDAITRDDEKSSPRPSTSRTGAEYEGYQRVEEAKLILTVKPTAANGKYEFKVHAASDFTIAASFEIIVSTKVDEASLKVAVDGGETEFGVSGGHKYDFKYRADGTNVHTFDFNFTNSDGTIMDRSSLTFKAKLTNSLDLDFGEEVPIKGYYSSGTQHYPDGGAHASIDRYVLEIPNVKIENAKLKLTVAQNGSEYDIEIVFNVHVPVTSAKLKINGNEVEGNSYSVVTSGESDYKDYTLSTVINGDDNKKVPTSCSIVYSLESDDELSGIYEIVGNKLRVYNSALTATTAKLVITATDSTTGTQVVVKIDLKLTTTKVELKFVSEELAGNERTQLDNAYFDYAVTVTNLGSGEVLKDAAVKYAYSVVGKAREFTVSQHPAIESQYKPSGNFGTFTVTASYVSGGKTYSITATVYVIVPVSDMELTRDEGMDGIALLKGQATKNTVTVKVKSAVTDLEPVITSVTVTSSSDDVVKAEYNSVSGTITLTPKAKGNVTITVTAYTNSTPVMKTFNVNVYEPELKISMSKAAYDIADFEAGEENRRIFINSEFTGAGIYGSQFNPKGENYTATNSLTVNYTSGLGTYVLVPSKLTSKDLAEYVITLNVTIEDVTFTASCSFRLQNEKFEPDMELRLNGAKQSADGSGYVVLDKTKSPYSVHSVSDAPACLAEDEYEVTFSSTSVTIGAGGVISGLSGVDVGTTFRITMHIVLLGKDYYKDIDCIVMDTTAMQTSLYISDTDAVDVADGEVTGGTSVSHESSVAVDFEDSPKYLTVVVKFPNAPAAVLAARATDFTVSNNANLKIARSAVKKDGNDFYFLAVYTIKSAGSILVSVHSAMLGGTAYAASAVSATLTASAPVFKAADVAELNPGDSGVITVSQTERAFKGEVEYKLVGNGDSYKFFTVSAGDSAGKFNIAAKVNVGGGSETVRIEATVKSGAYKDYSYVITVPVTVKAYSKPTATSVTSPLLKANEIFDMKEAVLNAMTKDSADSFDITLTEIPNIEIGSRLGTVYTAPSSCEDGAVIELKNMLVTVSGGFYKGTTFRIDIKIIVAPTLATLTADSESVLPGEEVRLSGKVGSEEGTYKVAYALSDTEAGWLRADSGSDDVAIFTANQYGGSVTVTATITILKGTYAGATYTGLTKTIEVRGLVLSEGETLSGKLGATFDLMFGDNRAKFLAGGAVPGSGEFSVKLISAGSDPAVTVEGSKIIVKSDAKYCNSVVRIEVTCTYLGKTYKGEFDFTVEALAVPALSVETKAEERVYTYTASEVKGAEYKLEVISGANLVTLSGSNYGEYSSNRIFIVSARDDTAGGVAIVRISMKIVSGDYEGTSYEGSEYSQTFEINVKAADKPTLTVTKSATDADSGQIKVLASDGYEVSGADCAYSATPAERITIDSNGYYSLSRTTTATTVTVTVRAVVHKYGAAYDGIVIEGSLTIDVPAISSSGGSSISASVKTEDNSAYIEVLPSNVSSKTFTVGANVSKYINIDSNGYFTLISGAGMPTEIEVTVSAVIQSGFMQRTYTTKVTIYTGDYDDAKLAPTGLSLRKSSTNALEGEFDITASSDIDILAIMANSPYLTVLSGEKVQDYRYRLTPATDLQRVDVTVKYLVTGGVWKGNVFTYTESVDVAALPELTVSVDMNADGSGGTITAEAEGATIVYSASDYSSYITLDASRGTFTFTESGRASKQTVKITVTATLGGSHAYAGYSITREVEVTTLPKLSVSATVAGDGSSGEIKPALTFGSARFYIYTLTSGSGIKLYSDGKFDVVGADENTVKVTAILDDGSVLETQYTFETVTFSASYEDGNITPSLSSGTATYEYTVSEDGEAYIKVEDGEVSVLKRELYDVEVTVTVKATVTTSDSIFGGVKFTYTVKVLVEASKGKVEATQKGEAADEGDTVKYVYTYTVTSKYAEGASVTASTSDGRATAVVGEDGTITVTATKGEESYTFTLTITVTLTKSAPDGDTLTVTVEEIEVEAKATSPLKGQDEELYTAA